MKTNILLVSAIVLMTLCACTTNEPVAGEKSPEVASNLLDPAVLVRQFHGEVSNIPTRAGAELSIDEISSTYYEVGVDGKAVKLTPGKDINCDGVFDVTTVKFHKDDNYGFAITSNVKGINRILFFAESGEVTDTINFPQLKDILENTPNLVANLCDPGDNPNGGSENPDDTDNPDDSEDPSGNGPISGGGGNTAAQTYTYGPLLEMYWSQGAPFNNLAPFCEEHNCNMPIGCVPVVVGQCIVYLALEKNLVLERTPLYNVIDYWSVNTPNINNYNSKINTFIEKFMIEIATGCQVVYDCNGTGSNLLKARNYLADLGYNVTFTQGELNINKLISEIKNGYPHIIGGLTKEKDGDGHAWVIDGVKKTETALLFHINWGSGVLYQTNMRNVWLDNVYYGYHKEGEFFDKKQTHLAFNY